MYNTVQKSDSRVLSTTLTNKCLTFLKPLFKQLDRNLDLWLIWTLADTVTAIVRYRQRSTALLLSELGAYLTGLDHAPPGTKRRVNPVHSPEWKARVIEDYLLEQGRRRV